MAIVILKTTTIGIPLSVRLTITIGKEKGVIQAAEMEGVFVIVIELFLKCHSYSPSCTYLGRGGSSQGREARTSLYLDISSSSSVGHPCGILSVGRAWNVPRLGGIQNICPSHLN
ncbi:hypothetical protein ILYODFUR_036602 [Ilyodon furcidens]|uniref:Uncharacterized protein n=1 Tax=Ilyodon furcidens TaxID=33524 RepID=A0ABV0TR10_9TELE